MEVSKLWIGVMLILSIVGCTGQEGRSYKEKELLGCWQGDLAIMEYSSSEQVFLTRGSRKVEKKWKLVGNFVLVFENDNNKPSPNSFEIRALDKTSLILQDGTRVYSFMKIKCQ